MQDVTVVHPIKESGKLICKICRKPNGRPSYHYDHFRNHHLPEHLTCVWRCRLCEYHCRWSQHIVNHCNKVHDVNYKSSAGLVCPVCLYSFNNSASYLEHVVLTHLQS